MSTAESVGDHRAERSLSPSGILEREEARANMARQSASSHHRSRNSSQCLDANLASPYHSLILRASCGGKFDLKRQIIAPRTNLTSNACNRGTTAVSSNPSKDPTLGQTRRRLERRIPVGYPREPRIGVHLQQGDRC